MFDPSISTSMAEVQKREQLLELKRRRDARREEGISLLQSREREGELAVPGADEAVQPSGELVAETVEDPLPESQPAVEARHYDLWAPLFLVAALAAALVFKVGRRENGERD